MTPAGTRRLPSVGEILAPVLGRIPREQQPLLIALAERLAAGRYRTWAGVPELASHRSELLACAAREEAIAAGVEALYPNAAALQSDLAAKCPELDEIDRELAAFPLRDQIAIQAEGERLGAATWRSFAGRAEPPARDAFEACAPLEEASAVVLEAILAGTLREE